MRQVVATVAQETCHILLRCTRDFINLSQATCLLRSYSMPKSTTRPYCSPDPAGPKYEQYCQHSSSLRSAYTQAYAEYLQQQEVPTLMKK